MFNRALIGAACALLLCAGLASAAGPTLPSQDPFYTYSGSLAAVAPGTVLRTRAVALSELGAKVPVRTVQVLYRTTGELGQPTATVETVIAPLLGVVAPTKLISYQTAYDGLGSECDPSYTLQGGNPGYSTAQDEEQVIASYVTAGFTVVVPDYEGTSLDWGAGQESGYGTLDGIRAAENLLQAPAASTPVGMIGYSGGSIATEFASELAPKYAPGLDLLGVAEGGVPVDFAHNLAYINGSKAWSGVIPAVLVGLGRAFRIDTGKYESAYGAQIRHQVENQCINNFLGAYPGLTIQKLLKPQYQNIFGIPLFARINNELTMSTTGTPKGPLLIGVGNADGTGDGVMIAADVEALAHTYCRRGVSVQFREYKGDDHTGAAIPFEAAAFTFLSERLNGMQVTNECASIGTGNSLAPLPIAKQKPIWVRLRYLGPRRHLHALVILLRTTQGTLRGVVAQLSRGGRRVDTVRVRQLSPSPRRVLLRVHRRMPRAGRYTLTIRRGHATYVVRALKVR